MLNHSISIKYFPIKLSSVALIMLIKAVFILASYLCEKLCWLYRFCDLLFKYANKTNFIKYNDQPKNTG